MNGQNGNAIRQGGGNFDLIGSFPRVISRVNTWTFAILVFRFLFVIFRYFDIIQDK